MKRFHSHANLSFDTSPYGHVTNKFIINSAVATINFEGLRIGLYDKCESNITLGFTIW